MTEPVHRQNGPRRSAAVSAAAALVLLLAGCSGGGDEEPSSSAPASEASSTSSPDVVSGSPSDSTAPSPAETGSYEPATAEGPAKNVPVPEMPEAVKEPTEEGLEATLEYWWEAEFYAKSTGDIAPLAAVSAEDCRSCAAVMEDWEWVYGEGGWAVSTPAVLDISVAEIGSDASTGTHLFSAKEHPVNVYRPDGALVENASDATSTDASWSSVANFSEEKGHWVLSELRVVKESQ